MTVRGELRGHLKEALSRIRTEAGYSLDVKQVYPFTSDVSPKEMPAIQLEDGDERYEEGPEPFVTRFLPIAIHLFLRWPSTLQADPDQKADDALADLERAIDIVRDQAAGGLIDINFTSNGRILSADQVYVFLSIEMQYRTRPATPGSAS